MSEDDGIPPDPVLEVPPPSEIKVLESADDIQVNIFGSYLLVFFLLKNFGILSTISTGFKYIIYIV